jgi:hypothetical protein
LHMLTESSTNTSRRRMILIVSATLISHFLASFDCAQRCDRDVVWEVPAVPRALLRLGAAAPARCERGQQLQAHRWRRVDGGWRRKERTTCGSDRNVAAEPSAARGNKGLGLHRLSLRWPRGRHAGESDGAPVQGATAGKWSRRWLPWDTKAGRRASDRGLPLDAIVNAPPDPRRRAQTRPATASAVPRHDLSRTYY